MTLRVVPPPAPNAADLLRQLSAYTDALLAAGDNAPAIVSQTSWRERLALSRTGEVRPTLANVVAILANDAAWVQRIRWDSLTQTIVFAGGPPFEGVLAAPDDTPEGVRQIEDADLSRIRVWIAEHADYSGMEPALDTVFQAVQVVAKNSPFHQVRAYLEGLPAWDGTGRVGAFARMLSAEETSYHRMVCGWWLISAVARAWEPGCKVDTILILEGPQGQNKSSAAAALVPRREWFTDSELDMGADSAVEKLRGKWVIELPELSSTKRGDVDRIKAFVSSQSDTMRPKYGRLAQDFKRTCVFIGSVNPTGPYLNDASGARRFWPVRCGGVIDRDAIARDRDQIWAEALSLYRAGARWWPDTVEEKELLAAEVQKRTVADTWEDKVSLFLDGRVEVDMADVFTHLGIDHSDHNPASIKRLGQVLGVLGWEKTRVNTGGKRKTVWVRPVA